MIYLASPYSHSNKFVRAERARHAARAVGALMTKDEAAFSPIWYGHSLEDRLNTSFDYAYWLRFGLQMLCRASRCYVLTLEGWRDSAGVREEVLLASRLKIPVIGYSFEIPSAEDASGRQILEAFGAETQRKVVMG